MNNRQYPSRCLLSRWVGWFFLANVGVLSLIGLSYLTILPNFSAWPLVSTGGIIMAWIFTVLAFVGQFSLFSFGACAIAALSILCYPRRWIAFSISIALATFVVAFIIADSIVYYHFRFHVGTVIWNLLISGELLQFLELSRVEWILIITLLLGILLAEIGLAEFLWRRVQKAQPKSRGRFIAMSLAVTLFLSYVMCINASCHTNALNPIELTDNHLLVLVAKIVPYYNRVLGALFPQYGVKKLASLDSGYFMQNKQVNEPLRYPLHPLQCHALQKPLNVVVIAIDTWRADMMNSMVTPHIVQFAKHAWQFTQHDSGGNCTRPGIFSLFYSLPPTYWTAAKEQHHGPLLIQQLIKAHYQLGIFASAELEYPAFDQTVFRDVPHLQVNTPGDSSSKRDKTITREFKNFILHRHQFQPFFSFLFYDEVHNWCGSSQPYAKPFQPAIKTCDRLLLNNKTNPLPYLNRYKNAVHFVDGLVGHDLSILKRKGLLKNTVVVITADHGEEFNDEHLGYWGHASAYDLYQVKTPFIVYWPNSIPRVIPYLTSHYDLVPTLMTKVLGCRNSVSDYSVGVPLLTEGHRPFFVIGSYVDYAVVKPHRITTLFPGGDYAITDANGHDDPNAKLDIKTLQKTFDELNRYFR